MLLDIIPFIRERDLGDGDILKWNFVPLYSGPFRPNLNKNFYNNFKLRYRSQNVNSFL